MMDGGGRRAEGGGRRQGREREGEGEGVDASDLVGRGSAPPEGGEEGRGRSGIGIGNGEVSCGGGMVVWAACCQTIASPAQRGFPPQAAPEKTTDR